MNEIRDTKPIRVLHYLADLNVASGVINVLMNYYRNVDHKQLQFDFLYFDKTEESYEEEITCLGGRCFLISKPGLRNRNELDLFFRDHLGEFDILHCHPVYAGTMFASIAKKYGIKHIIQHSHSTQFGHDFKSSIRNYIISRMNVFFVTDYMACSLPSAKLLGPRFVWKDKVKILNNVVDSRKFRFSVEKREMVRKELGLGKEIFVIGHNGRLAEEKNHMKFLEVFYQIHKLNPNSAAILVGDGPEREKLEQMAKQLEIENKVYFVGKQRHPEYYLSAMDVFLFPSFYEGLSLALLEAQCNGLPCVVSNTVELQSKIYDRYKTFALDEDSYFIADEILKSNESFDRYAAYETVKYQEYDVQYQAAFLVKYYKEI